MKRVAIPIKDNTLSDYFGTCNFYEIFEIEGESILKKAHVIPSGITAMELPKWLQKQGVTDVIAYKVDRNIISLFASKKVNLFVGVPVNKTQKLIDDYLNGKLESDKNIINEITNLKK